MTKLEKFKDLSKRSGHFYFDAVQMKELKTKVHEPMTKRGAFVLETKEPDGNELYSVWLGNPNTGGCVLLCSHLPSKRAALNWARHYPQEGK